MDLVRHLAYEIDRGVRALALHTGSRKELPELTAWIQSMNLDYIAVSIGGEQSNLFFGRPECIQALRRFSTLKLNEMSEEEDFMLGVMLGYDLCRQCARYDRRKLDTELAHEPCVFDLSEANIA
jgi:hypothetical protein